MIRKMSIATIALCTDTALPMAARCCVYFKSLLPTKDLQTALRKVWA